MCLAGHKLSYADAQTYDAILLVSVFYSAWNQTCNKHFGVRIWFLCLCQCDVAAGFTYVLSFVMHAYKASHITLCGGQIFKFPQVLFKP